MSPESRATGQIAASGGYVIVELSTSDAAAALYGTEQPQGAPAGAAAGGTPPTAGQGGPPAGGQGGPPAAGKAGTPPTIKAASAAVTQSGTVTATDGTTYPATAAAITTSAVVNLVVDDFKQFTFDDPATGQSLAYNLFVPKNYDKTKSYPLVLFMHDAGPVGGATIAPLVHGLGAVCWATAADQAERETFVLAPQYPTVVIDDNYRPTALFDTTVNLLQALPGQYSIDQKRIYATGQSMGAMMTLGINIKHPDLLAASFVVAGQWPVADVVPLATKKLWVVVAQGDDKAFPGENSIMDVIAKQGTAISRDLGRQGDSGTVRHRRADDAGCPGAP
jgi:predicted peptidase